MIALSHDKIRTLTLIQIKEGIQTVAFRILRGSRIRNAIKHTLTTNIDRGVCVVKTKMERQGNKFHFARCEKNRTTLADLLRAPQKCGGAGA